MNIYTRDIPLAADVDLDTIATTVIIRTVYPAVVADCLASILSMPADVNVVIIFADCFILDRDVYWRRPAECVQGGGVGCSKDKNPGCVC